MLETISLTPKAIIIKADNESDLSEVIDYIAKKGKKNSIDSLLDLASANRIIGEDYKFIRDDCYNG